MRISTAILLCCVVIALSCRRETPTQPLEVPSNWSNHFGGASTQSGISIQPLSQEGFVIAGYGTSEVDVYLLGINDQGDSVWARTYGSSGLDYGFSMQKTLDNGFIISGHTNSFGDGSYDVYLLRIDETGDTLWTRVYGAATRDQAYSVKQCDDGGFIVAGSTTSQELTWSDVYVIKTDALGNTIWCNSFGQDYTDVARSVIQMNEGYVVAGYSESAMFGDEDFFLAKLDTLGNVIWQKAYGGAYDDWANEIRPCCDGGYVLVGTTTRFGSTWEDACLIKVDENGIFKWKKTYGGTGAEKGFAVRETPDGGFVIVGFTTSFGEGDKDVYIIKTDRDGLELWSKTFGGSKSDVGFSIQETWDGGYIIAGYTDSFSDSRDIYVIKLESQ